MRTNTFRGLIFLLLAVTLASACAAGKNLETPLPGNSTAAGTSGAINGVGVGSRVYADPDDAFAVNIPAGWQVEREEHDGASMTAIRPGHHRAHNIAIMTVKAAPAPTDSAELKSFTLTDSSKPFFKGWLEGLREQARVEGTGEVYPTRFDNSSALRMDVTYYRGDADDPRQGRCVYLIGKRTTFFICLTASSSRFGELEEVTSTLRIEP
jgi:hypothetical protein